MLEQVEKQPTTSDAQLEEVVADGEVLETTEVITRLKSAEGTSEAEASGVLEEVVSKLLPTLLLKLLVKTIKLLQMLWRLI